MSTNFAVWRSFGQEAIGVVNPLLYRQIINNGVLKGDVALIVRLAIIVGLLGVLPHWRRGRQTVYLIAALWSNQSCDQK